jgi:hypothetical protein
MVTPHDYWRAIVTQQHLNNVQRKIFVTPTNEALPQDTADIMVGLQSASASASAGNTMVNTLQQQVQQLQQQLMQQEKDRAHDKIEELQQNIIRKSKK